MSGIAGTYYLNGRPTDRAALDQMLAALAYRGPDGIARWTEGSLGLGHLMLHTTPESRYEAQPYIDAGRKVVITADARIDNREELTAVLQPSRPDGRPVTDSELIVAAYKRWGEACPEMLRGDFAFALWDAEARRLFCACDHFGIKPFFYFHKAGHLFAFASEVKALLQLEEVPRTPNPFRIAEFLMIPVRRDHTQTYYQDVYSLPPGYCLTVDAKGVHARPYWAPTLGDTLQLGSDEAYAEALRERFTEAVRRRMRSDFPLGSMLSGGLDSSAITGTAAQLLRDAPNPQLNTFSALFTGIPRCDEKPYIDAVLEAYPFLKPHYFHGDNVGPLGDLDYVLGHCTGPYPGANLYISVNLYRQARATGTRVLFEGFDGDNVVSHGLGYFRELKTTRQWLKLILEVRAFSIMKGEPWRATVWSWIKGPVKQRLGIVAAKQLAKRVLGHPGAVRKPSAPAWHRSLNPAFAQALEPDIEGEVRHETERENHLYLLTQTVLPQSIREVLDPLAADQRLDVRYPFFDKELVEFCLALPVEQKIRRGWTRFVMRNAMEGILPEPVRMRESKSDYEPTFERSLFAFERERLEKIASGSLESIAQYVDIKNLTSNTTRYLAREPVGLFDRVFIWKALSLALWLQNPGSYRSQHKIKPKEVMPATAL